MTRSRDAAALASAVGGAVGVVAASFLPWLQSGAVSRSGYALAGSAWGAGLADVRLAKAFIVAWFLTPVAAAAAWTLASVGRLRAAGGAAVLTGLVGCIAGIAVSGPAGWRAGPVLALVTGAFAGVGGIVLMSKGGQTDE